MNNRPRKISRTLKLANFDHEIVIHFIDKKRGYDLQLPSDWSTYKLKKKQEHSGFCHARLNAYNVKLDFNVIRTCVPSSLVQSR